MEEIIKYVTSNKVDKETLDLLSKVNGHIRNCLPCREKVNACECLNDEFIKEGLKGDFDLNQISDLIKIKENINY